MPPAPQPEPMRRRRFLTATAGAGALLAGCQGSPGGDTGPGGDGDIGDGDGTNSGGTATDRPGDTGGLGDHAALASIGSQPYHGPPPGGAAGLIVAYEDPSCPRCAAFERQVVPEIISKLTDPGKATFVFRGYPVVYDWGEPATHALEAVYAADEALVWDLATHYFENQDTFSGKPAETVFSKTETLLAGETDLDAAAVVASARNGETDAAVQTDLDAGMAAGAGRSTPHIFLFRDGEYQTKAVGSVSYSVIESALGV